MSQINKDINEARRDMAAIFRWVVREAMHEGIANHFSCAVSDDGQTFLINPYGIHFSKLKASDLLLVDAHELSDEARAGGSNRLVHPWGHASQQSAGPLHRASAHALCHRAERS